MEEVRYLQIVLSKCTVCNTTRERVEWEGKYQTLVGTEN